MASELSPTIFTLHSTAHDTTELLSYELRSIANAQYGDAEFVDRGVK